MSLIESGGGENVSKSNASVLSETPVEDDLLSKLNKINNNKDIDNKDKIAEMSKLFTESMIPFYKEQCKNVVEGSAHQSFEDALNSDMKAKSARADMIIQKYQVLSMEY